MFSKPASLRVAACTAFVLCFVSLVIFRSGTATEANSGAAALLPPNLSTSSMTVAEVLGTVDGNADPGDTLEYTVTIPNTGPDPAMNVVMSDTLTGPQTLVPGSLNILPLAANDAYTAIGNVNMVIPDAAGDLLSNDADLNGGVITMTGFGNTLATANANLPGATIASANTGSLTVNANGSFNYNPPRGLNTTETFYYTVSDGQGGTDTGQVTITINGMIWFINAAAPVNGDGRFTNPYNNINTFGTANILLGGGANPDNSDSIFIYSGTQTSSALFLRSGQKVIGQGATDTILTITGYTAASGTSQLPATGGAYPVINSTANGIELSTNNTIRGVTVGNISGLKIRASNFGTLTIGKLGAPDVVLSGTGQAIYLDNGTIDPTSAFSSVATTSNSGEGIRLTNIAGGLSLGSTSVSGGSGRGILVTGSTANINFGNTTVSGGTDGIVLQNNSAGTRTFGTVNVGSHSGTGFLHTLGGGTTTVTGATTISFSANPAIDIQGLAALTPVTFAATTVNKSSGIGVNLGGASTPNAGNVTFASLAITVNGGSGGTGLLAAENTGTVTVTNAAGSSINTSFGPTLDITNSSSSSPIAMNYTTLTSTNSNTQGVNLNRVSGTLTAANGAGVATTSTNPALAGIQVQNSSAALNFGNTVSNTSAGTGVFLNANSGNVSFADLDIAPDANRRAFHATNNTGVITTTSGTVIGTGTAAAAVEISGTSSASRSPLNLQWTSVSANGAASGIVLLNTTTSGSPGGFRVIGNAGTCTLATPTCTGGTIQNTTGVGVSLNNAAGVVLTRMYILNTAGHGVNGVGVSGFTFSAGVVNGAGDADNESGIYFGTASAATANLSGTALIENSFINGSEEVGLHVRNDAGSLNLRVNNSDFTNSIREDGILLETFGSATITALAENSRFSLLASDGIMANANAGTLNFTAQNNTFTGCSVGCPNGNPSDNHISVGSAASANLNYTISGNTMNNSHNSAILLNQNDTSVVHGRILNNNITNTTNGMGIDGTLAADGLPGVGSTVRLLVQGNTISGQRRGAMFFNANDSSNMHVTIVSNTANSRPADTTTFENVTSQSNGSSTVCSDIRTNTVARGGVNAGGFGFDADSLYLFKSGTSTHNLERGVSASNVPQTVLLNNNPAANGATVDGPVVVVNPGTCIEPNTTTQPVAAFEAERKDHLAFDAAKRLDLLSSIIPAIAKKPAADTAAANAAKEIEVPHIDNAGYLTRIADLAAQAAAFAGEVASRLDSLVSPTVYAQREGPSKGGTPNAAPATGETVTTSPFTLPAGETVTIKFRATVDAGPYASGLDAVTNTANITATGVNVNTNTTSIALDAAPDLTVAKTEGGGTTQPGVTAVYTLSYSNPTANNGQHAANVVLTETVPANTTFNAAASTAGWSCADASVAGTTCTFSVGTVNAGAAAGNVNFAVNVSGALPAGVTQVGNTASVAENPIVNGTDRNPANNAGSDTTNIIGNWLGGTSVDWHKAANWSNGVVPPAGNNVSIPNVVNPPVVTGADVTLNNLVLNGESATLGAGRTITVNGTVTLGANIIDGTGTLSLGPAATIIRTTGQVQAALNKNFGGAGTFTYPVGTAGQFSPATVTVTAGSGDLSIRANAGTAPATAPLNDGTTLDRYWSLAETGNLTADLLFTYLDADVDGNENAYRTLRVSGGVAAGFPNTAPCPGAGTRCVDPSANTIFLAGVSVFGDHWTASEAAPTAANTVVSGRVLRPDGRGVSGSVVSIADGDGYVRYAVTNPFGYYRFVDIRAGATYVMSVNDKRFVYAQRVVNVGDELAGVDFAPEE